MKLSLAAVLACMAVVPRAVAQEHAPAKEETSLIARAGDMGFLKVEAESFRSLTPKQQELAYWLTQASIAIDPIIYDQLSKYGLRQKRLLEEIVAHPDGIDPKTMGEIREYTELFWGNRGNHDDNTSVWSALRSGTAR